MKATRRGILIVGRIGLVGLAGTAFVAAAHTGGEVLIGEAKKQKGNPSQNAKGGKKQRGKKKPPRHHGKKNQSKQHGKPKGVRLESGSLLPNSLIDQEAGKFSAHMLLPFEEFFSEAKLAEAVAEAESLNLFILPEAAAQAETTPGE